MPLRMPYKITALPATLMGLDDKIGLFEKAMQPILRCSITTLSQIQPPHQQANSAPLGIDYVLSTEARSDHGKVTDKRPENSIRGRTPIFWNLPLRVLAIRSDTWRF